MSKKQENKITKSVQFDFEYNENTLKPFLMDTGMSFSYYSRQLIIKDIGKRENDKRPAWRRAISSRIIIQYWSSQQVEGDAEKETSGPIEWHRSYQRRWQRRQGVHRKLCKKLWTLPPKMTNAFLVFLFIKFHYVIDSVLIIDY